MKKNVLVLITILFSCSSPISKESQVISDYVEKISRINITTGDIILINSSGCNGCIEKGLTYLEQNNLYDRYKVLIISKKALEEFDIVVNKSKFIVDNENFLEKLNISQSGFVVVRFSQSNIVSMFSLNPETDLNSLKKHSRSDLSSLHSLSCATCRIK